MFGRRKLPPPLDLDWPMKAWQDAELELRYERAHMIMTIEHELVRGVTPAMLDWWFRHIGGEMEINGRTYSRYRVWHPLDHIDWQLVEGDPARVGVGAKFRIIEAFNRNPAWLVDSVETVTKLDETGIRLERHILGSEVFSLEHWFEPADGGTRYRSRIELGADTLFGRVLFNRLIRPMIFSDLMGPAWLMHNVEEVGNLEHFLPALHAREAGP
ncbi:MAG: DAPG hydrolase family protein [Candidatus Limnocylindria bacterium]